jgi:hypothetical protein
LALLTYQAALTLIFGGVFWLWWTQFCLAWVFVIIVTILVLNYRYKQENDGLNVKN